MSAPSLIPSPSVDSIPSFSDLPGEIMPVIADFTDSRLTRLRLEYSCSGFAKTAEKCFEAGERWISLFNPDLPLNEQSESFLQMSQFYPSFRKRLVQLKMVDSSLSADYIFLMKKHFKRIVSHLRPDFPSPTLLNIILENKLLYDVVDSYANRDIEKITIQSFKRIRYFLHTQYPTIQLDSIEHVLRQAIKCYGAPQWKQEQRTSEIEAIRRKCLNPTEDFSLYIRERDKIKRRLEKEIEDRKQILTSFQPGDPIFQSESGKIDGIRLNLEPEALRARDVLSLQADFYLELNQSVRNPEERSEELRSALAGIAIDNNDPEPWDV